jgi:16S rRNA (adenine1518-N6/adenine1519-N6)-dimethyltransferase
MKPSEVRQLLRTLDIRPRKTLGQSFLIDRNIRRAHVDAARVGDTDIVLEVGPGLGALTELLVAEAGQVFAVEKDPRLFAYLSERFAGHERLTLIHADMLDIDADALLAGTRGCGGQRYKVVSNLPYASGSRILVQLIRGKHPPDHLVVTVQLEVAGRLCAKVGDSAFGMLSLWAQRDYRVKRLRRVSAKCFCPQPEVVSAIVGFERHDEHPLSPDAQPVFYDVTKLVFSQRRKQLVSILARAKPKWRCRRDALEAVLKDLDLPPNARPEQINVEQWCELAEQIAGGQLR